MQAEFSNPTLMPEQSTQLAVAESQPTFVKASTALSQQLGLEPRAMIDAIKSQFFKGKEASDAQLAVVVSIARELRLNPLIPGQLYPYPDRSGSVTVMIGPDGIYTLLANNPDIVAQKDGGPAYYVEHGKDGDKETCTGYINHRTKGLLKKTIWVDEWVVSTNPNWATRRHHMAEIRALKQAARMVVHGIPADSDEQKLGEMLNVTDTAEEAQPEEKVVRAPVPERAKTGAASVKNAPKEVIVEQEAPAAVAPAVETKTEAAKEAEPAQGRAIPRTSLQENETLTALVEVVSSKGATSPKLGPAAVATVKGGFNGDVTHFGGATSLSGNDATPTAQWKPGNHLTISLKGIKMPSGKIQARVMSVAQPTQELEE